MDESNGLGGGQRGPGEQHVDGGEQVGLARPISADDDVDVIVEGDLDVGERLEAVCAEQLDVHRGEHEGDVSRGGDRPQLDLNQPR